MRFRARARTRARAAERGGARMPRGYHAAPTIANVPTMAKKKSPKSKKRAAAKKPAAAQMLDLITGYWTSQALRVFAQLGIADLLHEKARTPQELAQEVDADPERLHRLLRALAPLGVVREKRSGRFALAPLGRTLC